MTFTTGMFIGVLMGILIQQYIFPIFDLLLEVFSIKQSEVATIHNLNIQEMSCEFAREYPEINANKIQEQTNLIGFTCNSAEDEDEYYEEDKIKNIIGFK